MHLEHLETPTHRESLLAPAAPAPVAGAQKTRAGGRFSEVVRSVDGDGQISGLIIRFEVDGVRIRVVGGMVGAVTLERLSRLEVEERGRRVGLALRLYRRRKRNLWCVGVDTRRELLGLLDGRLRMCWFSPVSTFTGVSVSSVNRTSSKVCFPRIASGANSQSWNGSASGFSGIKS